jgi:xanthine dehydrogenase/oxidase
VEGAYIQGIGYYTSEKLVYDQKTGKLLTNRSLNYHVPLALDIPVEFNVKLRYNSTNARGVLGSKGKLNDTLFNTIIIVLCNVSFDGRLV